MLYDLNKLEGYKDERRQIYAYCKMAQLFIISASDENVEHDKPNHFVYLYQQ